MSDEILWKEVDGVWVRQHDVPCLVQIVFTDPAERPRDLLLNLLGREIDHIDVGGKTYEEIEDHGRYIVRRGERWVMAPRREEGCEVLD